VSDLLAQLRRNQQRGSKPRCHGLTHGDSARRAAILTALIAPSGEVGSDDVCMPEGFTDVGEAQLHAAVRLLPDGVRSALASWWFAVPSRKATTPNWDIACTCRIEDQRGLLLIEAKAHHGELQKEECGKALTFPVSANSRRNHVRIGACLDEASIALASETGRPWALSRDHHYQMSNRFAWAWKLTELGVPVVLVYLGFLACDDMERQCRHCHRSGVGAACQNAQRPSRTAGSVGTGLAVARRAFCPVDSQLARTTPARILMRHEPH
jgi:hypothetical protein